jgi:hypothetical protein
VARESDFAFSPISVGILAVSRAIGKSCQSYRFVPPEQRSVVESAPARIIRGSEVGSVLGDRW